MKHSRSQHKPSSAPAGTSTPGAALVSLQHVLDVFVIDGTRAFRPSIAITVDTASGLIAPRLTT